MKLEIRSRGVKLTEELRGYSKERLVIALARYARHIDLVRVYFGDVNGPRGGSDKKCRIVVELPPRGRIVVAEVDTHLKGASAGAAVRAGFAVKRHVQRRRARRRRPAGVPVPV